jgi:hypothetical protein
VSNIVTPVLEIADYMERLHKDTVAMHYQNDPSGRADRKDHRSEMLRN